MLPVPVLCQVHVVDTKMQLLMQVHVVDAKMLSANFCHSLHKVLIVTIIYLYGSNLVQRVHS